MSFNNPFLDALQECANKHKTTFVLEYREAEGNFAGDGWEDLLIEFNAFDNGKLFSELAKIARENGFSSRLHFGYFEDEENLVMCLFPETDYSLREYLQKVDEPRAGFITEARLKFTSQED